MFAPRPFLEKLKRCAVMGIVNITGDSFSEGSSSAPESAAERAFLLFESGADILDLGAESTRPGSLPVSADEECRRLLPILEKVRSELPDAVISVDTRHGQTAAEALAAGADLINDVSMGSDPQLLRSVAEHDAALVLCHSRATPQTMMQIEFSDYPDGVRNMVAAELKAASGNAAAAGVDPEKIIFDPGIGFAKTPEQCRELIREAAEFDRDFLWLWGVSRKSFMGGEVAGRYAETLRIELQLIGAGASIIRTHDVKALRQAMKG